MKHIKYIIIEGNRIELNAVFPNWWNESALCYDTEGNEYEVPLDEIKEESQKMGEELNLPPSALCIYLF